MRHVAGLSNLFQREVRCGLCCLRPDPERLADGVRDAHRKDLLSKRLPDMTVASLRGPAAERVLQAYVEAPRLLRPTSV